MLQFFLKLRQKYSDFVNSDDCIGMISSISIRNDPNLFQTFIYGPIKISFSVICASFIWQFCYLFPRFSDLVNSNVCIKKIYLTKSNFYSKCDYKCDEDENKH